MAPKVSIVTCSHNRPESLRTAIESLRAQTDQDWEHLIYDDASTNGGVSGVLDWAKRDPRVRVWRGVKNLDRPAVLWNFMLDRAHGRYFTVLDDDNQKLPNFVEVMSRELDANPDIDVVTCGWRVFRPDGASEGDYFLNLSTEAERLKTLSTCDGGAMLYRREVFERAGYFAEDIRTNEDWDWLRRAVHVGKVKNLHEVHATYWAHKASRMTRAEDLGNTADVGRVKARELRAGIVVQVALPPFGRLTQSQKDVCTSVERGLADISWVTRVEAAERVAPPPRMQEVVGSNGHLALVPIEQPAIVVSPAKRDLTLIVSPFQQSVEDLDAALVGAQRVLSLHMEDPYALEANLERVRYMAQRAETWVCTNDAATVPYYKKVVGDRVIACQSLSADASVTQFQMPDGGRGIDVLLCGYAYKSRKEFVGKLLPMLTGLRVLLVGDGWEGHAREGVKVLPTQSLEETYRLHRRARAVVCLHRTRGDCSDSVVDPVSVCRGFMEGYSGARVFIDRAREYHSLDERDVVWFSEPGDLAGQLRTYLSMPADPAAEHFAEKCQRIYTHRARLARVINCVRAPRFLAEIP